LILRATHRLVTTLGVAVTAVIGAVAFKEPGLVLVAVPFALSLALSVPGRLAAGDAVITVDHARLSVGDHLAATISAGPRSGTSWLELRLQIPSALEYASEPANPVGAPAVAMTSSGIHHTADLVATRWGGGQEVLVEVISHDSGGFMVASDGTRSTGQLRIYPAAQHLRTALAPLQLRAVGGSHLSRRRGDGIEFAETRAFQPGDRLRAVNWRVSARRDGLWVTDRNPEMSGDVLLYIDSFEDAGTDREVTLGAALEAAATLSRWHLAANDRVGLVDLGGTLRWVEGGIGMRQAYRLAETLVESELTESWANKGVDVIPTRGLPPRSFVVALTPLNDERTVNILIDLRRRRFDLAVIDCSIDRPCLDPTNPVAVAAHRLAAMNHENIHAVLRRSGTAVARWQPGQAMAPVIDNLARERRGRRSTVPA
jgi:uncharacterized protein (DUF58 family)